MSDIVLTHKNIGKLVKEKDNIIKAIHLLESNGYIVKNGQKL